MSKMVVWCISYLLFSKLVFYKFWFKIVKFSIYVSRTTRKFYNISILYIVFNKNILTIYNLYFIKIKKYFIIVEIKIKFKK